MAGEGPPPAGSRASARKAGRDGCRIQGTVTKGGVWAGAPGPGAGKTGTTGRTARHGPARQASSGRTRTSRQSATLHGPQAAARDGWPPRLPRAAPGNARRGACAPILLPSPLTRYF